MKRLLLATCLLYPGCNQPSPIITPIVDIGCKVETAVTTAVSASISGALSCAHPDIIQANIQSALGNVNFCATATHQLSGAPKGPIGNVLCPIAVHTAIGFLSNSIPSAWGCTASTQASILESAIVSACEVAIPAVEKQLEAK